MQVFRGKSAGSLTWAAVIMVGTKDALSFFTLSLCTSTVNWWDFWCSLNCLKVYSLARTAAFCASRIIGVSTKPGQAMCRVTPVPKSCRHIKGHQGSSECLRMLLKGRAVDSTRKAWDSNW